MDVFSKDERRRVTGKEDLTLSFDDSGLYIITVAARVRGKESLRIEIDGRQFSSSAPVIFNGGKLKGLKEIILFILPLNSGKHIISLLPDQGADLESFRVFRLPNDSTFSVSINEQAEDGDRRPWVTLVLADLSFTSITPTIMYSQRKRDSDDVKIIIDGQVQGNWIRTIKHFLWRFAGSLLPKGSSKTETETFTVNLPQGLHYIEFWADRMPVLHNISLTGVASDRPVTKSEETIEDKIRSKAIEFGFDPEMILRLVRKESTLNPQALSSKGAKGLFQLTDITIKQIANLGFKIDDPYNVDQNIKGGMTYFKWLYGLYENQEDRMEKTLAAWNWGLGHISVTGPLNTIDLPLETKEFIKYVLNKNEI